MTTKRPILQIRNGLYFLCAISSLAVIVGVCLNIYLTNHSLSEMKVLASTQSSEQTLIDELNDLLESNRIEALIARCEQILVKKPLSRSANYYLGLAYYHSGDSNKCRKYLENALQIDPTWKGSIEPYLDKL